MDNNKQPNNGGNSHQRAVRAAATTDDPMPEKSQPGTIPTPMESPRKRHTFGDSLALLAFPAALLMWAFIPTFWLRVIAILVAMAVLVYLSYRSHWAHSRTGVRHACAVAGVLTVGTIGVVQLRSQWKMEHPRQPAHMSEPSSPPPPLQSYSPAPPLKDVPPPQPAPRSVPATAENLLPLTIADVNKIVHRIGNPYQSQHPNAGRLELQAAINKELAREGYRFRVNLPRLAQNPPPPSLFGGGEGFHLEFSGITLETSPGNKMTAISTGNRSPVTMTGGGIEGFDNAIKTGNDSPVDLNGAQIAAPKPPVPDKKPEATPQ